MKVELVSWTEGKAPTPTAYGLRFENGLILKSTSSLDIKVIGNIKKQIDEVFDTLESDHKYIEDTIDDSYL